jgi:hypothetical protein
MFFSIAEFGFKKMPPDSRLDTCEILKILAWTNRKAPNN